MQNEKYAYSSSLSFHERWRGYIHKKLFPPFLSEMSIKESSQGSGDRQRQASPAAGEELVGSAALGSRGKASDCREVIIRAGLLNRAPAAFELHQAGVLIRCASEIEQLIPVLSAPGDRLPG